MDTPVDSVLPDAGISTKGSVKVLTYEQQMDLDPEWAMSEGSRHFDENSRVFLALKHIAQRLSALEIPYAVIGGMAMFRHGYRRFTEDVDILVTKDDLKKIHQKLEGLGYLPPHRNSRHLRDTEYGVKIEFFQTGDYPGDGLEMPLAFPDPQAVAFEADGIRFIKLENLIDLKLASGMTGAGRLKDLADVLELIKLLNLPLEFVDRLHPYVREKFQELARQATTRYVLVWRNELHSSEAQSVGKVEDALQSGAELLKSMQLDGAILEEGSLEAGYARLSTTDPRLAEKYDMVDEADFWDEEH